MHSRACFIAGRSAVFPEVKALRQSPNGHTKTCPPGSLLRGNNKNPIPDHLAYAYNYMGNFTLRQELKGAKNKEKAGMLHTCFS